MKLLRSGWWLVLSALAVATALALAFVLPQPPVYESVATFVVHPRSPDPTATLRAVDTLIRGTEINATYAGIAESDLVRERAGARLGPGVSTRGMTVVAVPLAGTNVLSVAVQGRDPEAARAFTDAVGQETAAYVADMEVSYRLEPLDPPTVPGGPVGPGKLVTIALAMALGAAAGVLLAWLREHLRSGDAAPAPPPEQHWPMAGPGAERQRQYDLLREQMRRALREGEPFSFGVVNTQGPEQALQADLVGDRSLVPLGGGTFIALFPHQPLDEARERLGGWLGAAAAGGGAGVAGDRPRVSAAVCEFRDRRFTGDVSARHLAQLLGGRPQVERVVAGRTLTNRSRPEPSDTRR